MKRKQSTKSNKSSGKTRVIEPRRLAEARGGADLGIIVGGGILPEDIMQNQHNEALIKL